MIVWPLLFKFKILACCFNMTRMYFQRRSQGWYLTEMSMWPIRACPGISKGLTFPHFNNGTSASALRTLAACYASFKINTFKKEVYILTSLSAIYCAFKIRVLGFKNSTKILQITIKTYLAVWVVFSGRQARVGALFCRGLGSVLTLSVLCE